MFNEESQLIRRQQKFLQEVEDSIREANRAIIGARIPNLNRQSFVAFATFVAHLRADYLAAALEFQNGEGNDGAAALKALRGQRKAFEETRDAFAALERAIERGYVDMD